MKHPVPLVFLILGIVFGGIGAGFGIRSVQCARSALEADGVVVDLRRAGKGGSRPVVEYRVGDQVRSVEGSISTKPPAYSVGDKVRVLYDPANPPDARINSFVERWLFSVIFGGVGILFLGVPFVTWCLLPNFRTEAEEDETRR